ncbi:hypothetical protein KAU11_10425 [Candidatus Babeliales bacterium]|nr:hypothetical protein [Candidatus Babeliales bacterium]
MSEDKYITGLFVKAPHEKAPAFVLAKGSINVEKMLEYLQNTDEQYLNFNILKGRNNNVYAEKDNWKPDASKAKVATAPKPAPAPQEVAPEDDINPEDIPF